MERAIPEDEVKRVTFEWPPNLYICGDIFQIVSCFLAVLSYLLRVDLDHLETERGHIKIIAKTENNFLKASLSGIFPDVCRDRTENNESYHFTRARIDVALGAPILKQFAKNNDGSFEYNFTQDQRAEFFFSFPLAKEVLHA